MINVTDHLKYIDKILEITDKYFELLPSKDFAIKYRQLHSTKLTLKEREKNYEKLKPLIKKLKKLFREKVKSHNLAAKALGYKNHLQFYLASKLIPEKDFDSFLKNINKFITLVYEDFPATELDKEIKNWGILNIPAPDGTLRIKNKFTEPNEIIDKVSMYDMRILAYGDKLRFKIDKENVSAGSANYNEDSDVVEIKLGSDLAESEELDKSLIFVHELGHALDYLESSTKKLIPHTLSKYLQEYSAEKFTFDFINKHIPDKEQKLIRYNLLYTLACTLFEIDIFTNEKQDFDKAYAKAINKCYPKANQTKNPLYVFNERFLIRPLAMLPNNIAKTEFYIKETENN